MPRAGQVHRGAVQVPGGQWLVRLPGSRGKRRTCCRAGASAVEAWWAVAGGDGGAAVGVNPGSIGLGDDGWVSSKDASDD